MSKKIIGDTVLYHYLQKDLYANDIWFFQMLAAKLVTGLGIWFDSAAFAEVPFLVPYAVRDNQCRSRNSPDGKDYWAFPNEKGFFRDDNSLIKNIPISLAVRSPLKDVYDGKRIGTGFVASHIWRIDAAGKSAASNPLTNSFMPNLVWLPAQVSRLTDVQGSFTQGFLQALSRRLFASVTFSGQAATLVRAAWDLLPSPAGIPESGLPDPESLNYFVSEPTFVARRQAMIQSVNSAIGELKAGRPLPERVINKKYAAGLSQLPAPSLSELEALISPLSEMGGSV